MKEYKIAGCREPFIDSRKKFKLKVKNNGLIEAEIISEDAGYVNIILDFADLYPIAKAIVAEYEAQKG